MKIGDLKLLSSVLAVPGFAVSTIAPSYFPRPQATNTCLPCAQLGCQEQSSWEFKKLFLMSWLSTYASQIIISSTLRKLFKMPITELYLRPTKADTPGKEPGDRLRRLLGDADACWCERNGLALYFTSNFHVILPALSLLCPLTVFMLSFACFFGFCFVETVAQTGLRLMVILLPCLHKCWDHRYAPAHPAT